MERLFDPLCDDSPLPPSTVDIQKAMRDGRRRVRARWAGVGTVLAVVLAVVVPVLSHTAVGGAPVQPAVQPESSTGFDPMRRIISIGDVPRATPHSYTTGRRWQHLGLKLGTSGMADVIVYQPGWHATYATGGYVKPESGTPAEPVAGRRAFWHSRALNGTKEPMLVWEWSDDAWAVVQFQGSEENRPDRDVLHRIAAAVRVTEGEQVTMPFTIPALDGQHVIGTTTQIRAPGDPFIRTGLLLDTKDPGDSGRYASDQRGFAIAVENGWKMGQKFGANQKLGGHDALVVDGQVHIFGLTDGFAIEVSGAASQDTLSAVAQTVQLLPAPSDRSTWTPRPIR